MIDKVAGWVVWVLGGLGALLGAWALWATVQRRQAPTRKALIEPEGAKHRQLVVEREAAELDTAHDDLEASRAELAAAATQPPSDERSHGLADALNSRR